MTSLMTWLVPAHGSEREYLAATIARLAREQQAPAFEPHVTMMATFDAAEDLTVHRLESLVAGVAAFDVTFPALGHEQEYFRALYLRAEPSVPLMALHEAGRRAWALGHAPYMPHLSLLYCDISEERKRHILDTLGIPLPLTARFDAIELWADDGEGVSAWRQVARVALSGG